MINESLNLNDKKVKDATKALEDSMDTREIVRFNLTRSNGKDDLAMFEMDLDDLNITSLNGKVGSRHT